VRLAEAHARTKNWAAAIADLSTAIALSGEEPAHYFDRGRLNARVGAHRAAVADFSVGLELCERHGAYYYRDALRLFRAYCRVELNERDAALQDLLLVPDDCQLWLNGLQSKMKLLERCRSTEYP